MPSLAVAPSGPPSAEIHDPTEEALRRATAAPPAALVPVVGRPVPAARVPLWRRLLSEFTGIGLLSTRYSVAKFREYDAFRTRDTSVWRRAAVVLLAPAPSLLVALLPPLIPLQDPARGVWRNTGYMAHFFLTLAIVLLGSVFQMRAPARIPRSELSHREALAIAVVGALLLLGVVTAAGHLWRFPVPFVWVTAYAPYILCFVGAHAIVLRRKLARGSRIRASLAAFLPSYIVQGSQVVVYPAFSAVYARATAREQLALTLFFPVIKHAFRRVVHAVTARFPDDAEQESVSGIEVCAVMYQSIIMQSTLSPYTTALLMSSDVVLGLFSVYVLMAATEAAVPQHEILPRARALLCGGEDAAVDERELAAFSTVRRLPRLRSIVPLSVSERVTSRLFRHRSATANVALAPAAPRRASSKSKAARPRGGALSATDKKTITNALELLQAAETVALIEYIEVFIPLVNALYVLWASQFRSARFTPTLREYHEDRSSLASAVQSLVLYAVLQALSVALLQAAVWCRYRVSALAVLAFVLERHAWSLQGKLLTWLTLIFQFPVAHYGVDFQFRFDYGAEPPLPRHATVLSVNTTATTPSS